MKPPLHKLSLLSLLVTVLAGCTTIEFLGAAEGVGLACDNAQACPDGLSCIDRKCAEPAAGDAGLEDAGSGPYDLTLSGTAFQIHSGQSLFAAVVHYTSGDRIAGPSATTVSGGAFSVSWYSILERGEVYQVHYYADFDNSGGCGEGDHSWVAGIDAAERDVVLDVTHTVDFTDICATFEESVDAGTAD